MGHGTEHFWPVTVIVVSYLIFAWQVASHIDWSRAARPGVRALVCLVIVFIFCALSGYVSDFFPDYWTSFRVALHWVLAVAAIGLIATNQAGAVTDKLQDD